MVDKNNYEVGIGDLENREFRTETTNEQEIKPTSLGKARDYTDRGSEEPALLPGYHEIYSEHFPSKGLFYPNGTRFMIRAASVKEIRHFSTINERDPFSVDEALNEILNGCMQIRVPGRQSSFKDLKEEDRIFIIMAIRELTFVKGENRLILNVICKECNTDNEIDIRNEAFESTPLEETIMKYYNSEARIFEVQTKSSGTIKMVPPSIGIMREVTKYIQKVQQEGKKIDQSFIKVLPYMVQEWRGFGENTIKNLEVEFMRWDATRYQIFSKLTEMTRVGVKEELSHTCSKCGTEVRTPISFPGGIKSLFVISDISGELI
jgi:RNase P subunit RPR2